MHPTSLLRKLATLSIVVLPVVVAHAAASWRPIPPEEFAAEPSALDPSAGAVVLLREITIDNGDFDGATQAFYVRIKVFDQKGIEALLQTQIPYEKGQRPRNLAARVVKPDGSSIEVEKASIFTREVMRVGREALLVKSFSFPGLEPGCIIEYRYSIYSDDILLGMHLPISDEFPIETARIRMKNFSIPGLGIQSVWSHQLNLALLPKTDRGFRVFEGQAIAPAVAEPLSPPDSSIKPWFTYFFTPPETAKYDFWSYEAGALAAATKQLLAPKKPLKDMALSLTAGLPTDPAKLRRLYDFCRTEIKNLSYDTSGYTPEAIEALKPNRSPADTLKNRYGTERDINVLFGALVQALGAQCSLAYCGDRSLYIFHPNLKLRGALPHIVVGIARGAGYEFYDPGAMYLPVGQLRWMNDTTKAIVIKGDYYYMIDVPGTEPEYSTSTRTARLRLDESGTLAGEVTITLTGHDGIAAKHEYDAKTDDERRAAILAALEARLGPAEISDLVIEHVTDPDHPVQIRYQVKVPAYAEFTSGRIFFEPAFFQKGVPALFTAAERKNDIFFPYQYTTKDEVTIQLPDGFELEAPRAPVPVNVNHLLLYQPTIEYARRAGRVVFHREFSFYGQRLPAASYPLMKKTFDRVAAQDTHKLALLRTVVEAETGAPAGTETRDP